MGLTGKRLIVQIAALKDLSGKRLGSVGPIYQDYSTARGGDLGRRGEAGEWSSPRPSLSTLVYPGLDSLRAEGREGLVNNRWRPPWRTKAEPRCNKNIGGRPHPRAEGREGAPRGGPRQQPKTSGRASGRASGREGLGEGKPNLPKTSSGPSR